MFPYGALDYYHINIFLQAALSIFGMIGGNPTPKTGSLQIMIFCAV